MRFSSGLTQVSKTALLVSALCLCGQAQAQEAAPPAPAPLKEQVKKEGMPARASAGDYLSQGKAASVTIGAEFKGHFVPTPDGLLSTDDFVVVEVGLFGPPDARLKLSFEDFSLRLNGKKAAEPSQSDVVVFKSVKDPEWEPPDKDKEAAKAGKTSMSSGGRGAAADSGPPPVVHPPLPLQRSWEHRVEKASLMEGERLLPQAGLLFFKYGGKTKNLRSIELIYNGAGGKTILALQPE
jgi:hypothetical protein